MRKKTIALFDPYLDTMGGGEKHILSILKVFDDQGAEVTIFWDEDLTQEIYDRFRLSFSHLRFRPNIFTKKTNFFKKWGTLFSYNALFYVTDGSYFLSPVSNNYVFAMVPRYDLFRKVFSNMVKWWNYRFVANSSFTRSLLTRWGIKSEVIYPYIDTPFFHFDISTRDKENMILSVGRFFGQLHSKQHAQIIQAFRQLKQSNSSLGNYKLVLAGSFKEEDRAYLDEVQSLIAGDPSIEIKVNVPFPELIDLYKKARFYWHFTGWGVDEKKHPEQVEHLGITPLEAMAAGCIVFCYNAGGPKELIRQGSNGYLFSSEQDLYRDMYTLIFNRTMQQGIMNNARNFVKENFSYDVFRERVKRKIRV